MLCCSSGKEQIPEEAKPLTQADRQRKAEQDAKVVGGCARCVASCCCMAIIDREDAKELVTQDTSSEPSLYQRLCMCQCAPRSRPHAGIEMIPELQGLAGVTLQKGDHETAGSLQTLKWGTFDADKRVMEMAVFGGFYSNTTGVWTEPVNLLWCFLANLGRTANYTYRFEFSEDWQYADIKIKGNPLFVCCLCCTCIPAWLAIPDCITKQTMRQSQDSENGSAWDRFDSRCSAEPRFYYKLIEVIDFKGDAGPFHKELDLSAPKQQMITF